MIKSKSIKGKTKEEIMIGNLRDIKEIFDKHNIKFWLDWGTLLGAIRDGEIMEYDDDIDIGMMKNDFEKIHSILPEINKKGFSIDTSLTFIPKFCFLRQDYSVDIWPYSKLNENTFLTYGSAPLKSRIARVLRFIYNLFMCQKTNANLIISSSKLELIIAFLIKGIFAIFPYKLKKSFAKLSQKILMKNYIKRVKVIIPKYYFEKFRNFEFYNITFNVPLDADGYLRYKYGEDWKIPRQKWDWVKEDKAVKH